MNKYSKEFFKSCGRKGGLKSASLKTRDHFVMMGKKSAEAKNKKRLEGLKAEVTLKNLTTNGVSGKL